MPTGRIRVALLAAIVLTVSGCGSSRPDGGAAALPAGLAQEIDAARSANGSGASSVRTIEVYGPASRATLVEASSGEVVAESSRERKARFYLIVLRGHFVCESCSRPPGGRSPRGTIETQVWSPTEGETDFGISDKLSAGMSRLSRLAVIAPS